MTCTTTTFVDRPTLRPEINTSIDETTGDVTTTITLVPDVETVQVLVIETVPADQCSDEDDVEEPEYGTGTATVNANIRSDPSLSGDATPFAGDVTVTGQTVVPDEDGHLWYAVQYESGGETVDGWVRSDVIDNVDIDWIDNNHIAFFNADGTPLEDEAIAADMIVAAQAQQTLLEEYGIDVQMPVDGEVRSGGRPRYRPILPSDVDELTETLAMVETLDAYGVELGTTGALPTLNDKGEPVLDDAGNYVDSNPNTTAIENEFGQVVGSTIPWTPDEIEVVYGAVMASAAEAYDRALELGYDVDSPDQVFRDLWVNNPNNTGDTTGTLTFNRYNGPTYEGAFAYISGSTITMSNSAFYSSGRLGLEPGLDPAFTPLQLATHELSHRLIFFTNPDYVATGEYTLQEDQPITYLTDDGVVTDTLDAGTVVTFENVVDGYTFAVRSSDDVEEIETDAVTGYILDPDTYALGGEYDLQTNTYAVARQEQGEAAFDAVLLTVYGEAPGDMQD